MMQTQQPRSPLDIKIGSPVRCRDGRVGGVSKLVVDPARKRVTHLVLEQGWKLTHDVAVPIERVQRVEDGWVVLDMSVDELNALPEYNEIDYAIPDSAWAAEHGFPPQNTVVDQRSATPVGDLAPAWSGFLIEGHTHEGISPQETPVGRGARVTGRDGALGRLDHVLLSPTSGAVQALVVRKGHLLTKDVIVPANWIERVSEDEIVLAADRALLEQLPEYKPAHSDAKITAAVQQALAADPRTRAEQNITVSARDGVVYLDGRARTEDTKRAAAEVAGRIPGVWEVENGLTAESAVATAVSQALECDPRTSQAVIDVSYQSGTVTLRGQVRTLEEKAAAVAVAKRVPGVVTVVDELDVQADAPRKSWPAPTEESLLAAAVGLRAPLPR